MNRFIGIFLLFLSLNFSSISNAYAGTDIINNLLIKAGNVIDKVALKYQKISIKINELTEGKMFQLDETTSDLIRNLMEDYYLTEAKIKRFDDDIKLAKEVYQDAVDYYNQVNERMNEIQDKAEDLLRKRGWNTDNASDDSDEANEEDEDESFGSITNPRATGSSRTIVGGGSRGDDSSSGSGSTRKRFIDGDDTPDNQNNSYSPNNQLLEKSHAEN